MNVGHKQPLLTIHLQVNELVQPLLFNSINVFLVLSSPSVKNCFRVSSRGRTKAQSHSLQANDSFNKQQWISCLRQAIIQSRDRDAQASQSKVQLDPEPQLEHIAELSLNSDVEMIDT